MWFLQSAQPSTNCFLVAGLSFLSAHCGRVQPPRAKSPLRPRLRILLALPAVSLPTALPVAPMRSCALLHTLWWPASLSAHPDAIGAKKGGSEDAAMLSSRESRPRRPESVLCAPLPPSGRCAPAYEVFISCQSAGHSLRQYAAQRSARSRLSFNAVLLSYARPRFLSATWCNAFSTTLSTSP